MHELESLARHFKLTEGDSLPDFGRAAGVSTRSRVLGIFFNGKASAEKVSQVCYSRNPMCSVTLLCRMQHISAAQS